MKTWADIQSFIRCHDLPYNVLRFNVSLRGYLIDVASGQTLADTVEDAVSYLVGNNTQSKTILN